MDWLWLLLTIFLLGIGAIVCLVLLALLFGIVVTLYARDLQFKLPWMKWMTLDDVKALGHSKFLSRFAIDILHDYQYVEIRPLGNLSEWAREIVEDELFMPWTVQYYEFRLIKRKGRIKRPRFYWNPFERPVPIRLSKH